MDILDEVKKITEFYNEGIKPLPMIDEKQDAVFKALYAYQDYIIENTKSRDERIRLSGLFADFMENSDG